MRSLPVGAFLLLCTVGGAILDADVTVRGRIVTTETPAQIGDPSLGQAAGALAGVLGKAGGGLTDFLTAGSGPQPPTSTAEDFVIYFKDGRMRMDTGSQTLVIRPGRDGSAPVMLMLDHRQQRALSMSLATAEAADASADLTASAGTIKALGQTRPLLGYSAEGYTFSMAIDSGMFASPAAQASGAAAAPEAKNEGTAWLARDAPGLDEVQRFYQGFAASLKTGGTMFATAGLAASMAMLVERGFPLEVTQKTSAGIQTPLGATPLGQSTSTSTVSAILLDPIAVSFYDEGPPAGYQLMSWPGSQTASRSGAELPCDCTCAAFQAYRDLDARARRSDAKAKAELEARSACVLQCIKIWIPCMKKEN